jgi:hypothetical protein
MSSTINKKAVRDLLLATAKKERPFQNITRVGEDAYPKIEAAVRRAAAEVVRAMSRSGQTINILVAAGCLGILQAAEPTVVLFEQGPVVVTTASPEPVVVTQRTGPLWTTSTGAQLIPVNVELVIRVNVKPTPTGHE